MYFISTRCTACLSPDQPQRILGTNLSPLAGVAGPQASSGLELVLFPKDALCQLPHCLWNLSACEPLGLKIDSNPPLASTFAYLEARGRIRGCDLPVHPGARGEDAPLAPDLDLTQGWVKGEGLANCCSICSSSCGSRHSLH